MTKREILKEEMRKESTDQTRFMPFARSEWSQRLKRSMFYTPTLKEL